MKTDPNSLNPDKQHTLAAPAAVSGHCLFNNTHATATFHPAPENHGITFLRTDLDNAKPIPAHIDHAEHRPRRTALRLADNTVELVEHCLAALAALNIDNCAVHIDAPELPNADASAKPFADAFLKAGLAEQNAERRYLTLTQPVHVADGPASIVALPPERDEFHALYVPHFDNQPEIPQEPFAATVTPDTFLHDIAPARTFTTENEARAARDAGMFTHISPAEVLVFSPNGPVDNTPRFHNEPARHKLLDLVGDLALTARPLRCRIVAQRSGHDLNRKLARRILDADHTEPSQNPFAIRRILDILPHRYPMLLVDRVLSNDNGKSAIGIKNVTLNEPFFQGHYPHNPIMPGVLIIESMGQLAGIMLAETLDSADKIALLLALDEVKLRKPVVPGDQLTLHATTIKHRPKLAEVQCTATVDGQTAAEARLKFMLVDKEFDPR